MRKNERERLARRAEYLKSRPPSPKVIRTKAIGRTKDGKPVTQAHAEEFENEATIALHESSHIVAAWMLGVPIGGMQFNDGAGTNANDAPEAVTMDGIRVRKHSDEVPDFYAQTEIGCPVAEMRAKSMGERLVHGKQHAFISLAGVFGCSNHAWSDNPLCQFATESHLSEAGTKLMLIGGVSKSEAGDECARLISHVARTFHDERVQAVTHALATQLLTRRKLTGEEATAIIEQAWKKPTEEHERPLPVDVR